MLLLKDIYYNASQHEGDKKMKEEKTKWSENKNIKQIQWLCFTAIGFLGGYIAAETINLYGVVVWIYLLLQCQKKLYKWEVME